MPVADEVWRLQRGKEDDCRYFQTIAEQGHYAGKSRPTDTRQGIYAAAPSGVLLASVNSNDAQVVAKMLTRGLAAWEALPAEKRRFAAYAENQHSAEPESTGPADGPDAPPAAEKLACEPDRLEKLYPADGLVLRVTIRDLPRPIGARPPRAEVWNDDFAWFRKAEARALLPDKIEVGAQHIAPPRLIARLARCNLVDFVFGQTVPFAENAVIAAEWTTQVTAIEGRRARITIRGHTRTATEGIWPIAGFNDMNDPKKQRRGVSMRLLGHAEYDLDKERFVAFELAAIGTRFGATQFNGRHGDKDEAPLGFLFTLAEDTPDQRVAPGLFRGYGWR